MRDWGILFPYISNKLLHIFMLCLFYVIAEYFYWTADITVSHSSVLVELTENTAWLLLLTLSCDWCVDKYYLINQTARLMLPRCYTDLLSSTKKGIVTAKIWRPVVYSCPVKLPWRAAAGGERSWSRNFPFSQTSSKRQSRDASCSAASQQWFYPKCAISFVCGQVNFNNYRKWENPFIIKAETFPPPSIEFLNSHP